MRLFLSVMFFALLSFSCGDGLSSLEAVKKTARGRLEMYLSPDFGRQGDRLMVTVAFDEDLKELLRSAEVFFPTEIGFGDGVQIEYFKNTGEFSLEVGLRISPLAETGERRPTLVFSLGNRRVTAEGKFFVLPALPEK